MLLRLRDHWLQHHAQHLAGAQLALVCALTAGAAIAAAPQPRPAAAVAQAEAAPPVLTPAAAAGPEAGMIRLQDLPADAARRWNASNPVSDLPNPPAKPFRLKTASAVDEARAVDCMTAAVYYEAAYESLDGQRAVAQVVLNRLRHPAFPKTVCGVVFQGSERRTGCQFTFTCDGSLNRDPNPARWSRAREVAKAALYGHVMKKVGNATHYHADYVAPYWSPSLVKVGQIGAHIFYRWTGGWGLPPAFGGRYAGGEGGGVQIAKLDGLGAPEARLQLTSAPVETTVPDVAPRVEPAPLAPVAEAAEAAAAELITPAEVATDAAALLTPEDLDWAGRPKPKAPPRIAVPSAGPGFGGPAY